jgi:hypothetical protein
MNTTICPGLDRAPIPVYRKARDWNKLFGVNRRTARSNGVGESMKSTVGLTSEQRRLIEHAGDQPVRSPELHKSYAVIRAESYEPFREMIEPRSSDDALVPEGIHRSELTSFGDLPELLKDGSLTGRYRVPRR